MALGKNIARLRALTGETRPDLARAIGIESQQPIYALETRDSSRSDLAPKLARHFRVGLNVLLEDDLTHLDSAGLDALRRSRKPSPGLGKKMKIQEQFDAAPGSIQQAVRDLLELPIADAEKVAALIAAFRGG
ncbi:MULTISPECIES: helix-turn-helix transcriptional regulator [Burkholderia]|uniref:helix-turn-helix transcriptional regulator n=1 Tax=Burkholderia TaxID=32008 RepID=UPI000755A292|nr:MULTISPECIES: hypothetical protein [Burkholderia]AOJ69155.1 hypothetical protein WS78_10600 [Burkholderia savannae]KVG39405.1 hypothetical protein WS77_19520 [Burkholderia sp. MSMB0265]KVG80397.1 hypothetical protein WS81_13795 [Burkholderia sp. MSMB2040]KVG93230.1 hypothetical protein WS83_00965 [Burkholderia sp. MSMB2042]KVG98066.1 hypothetical protein WS82_00680 [Burkholderia sp. MSMB2041]